MKKLISQDPQILGGKPIISGTRMSVESVLELLSSGMEIREIIKEYPFLTKKQIQSVVDYAAKMIGKEESYIFDRKHVIAHEISRRR